MVRLYRQQHTIGSRTEAAVSGTQGQNARGDCQTVSEHTGQGTQEERDRGDSGQGDNEGVAEG